MRDTHALLPTPPPHPRLRRRIPVYLAGGPHPTRAFGAPPPPPAGAGSVRGDTWWAAVSGSSPGSPHAVDRVDIAAGGGADGEGELVPPPLSPTLQTPCSLPALSRPRLHEGYPYSSAGGPHPACACGAPPPPPARAGSVPGRISGEQPCPGWSRREVRIRLFPTYPLALDRGDIAIGGRADGEGELVPPPLSPTLPELRISRRPCPGSL